MSNANPFQSAPIPADPSVAPPAMAEVLRESTLLLAQTKPWVRFLAVLGFLVSLIGTAVALLSVLLEGDLTPESPFQWGFIAGELAATLFMCLIAYFIPSLLLWKYGSRIGEHLGQRDSSTFLRALASQKSFWKYVGVLALIMIAFYGVAMLGFALLPSIMGAMD